MSKCTERHCKTCTGPLNRLDSLASNCCVNQCKELGCSGMHMHMLTQQKTTHEYHSNHTSTLHKTEQHCILYTGQCLNQTGV